MGESVVIGTAEVARRLGCSQRTAQRRLRSGWLPTLPAPPGAWYRVSLEELRARHEELKRRREADATDATDATETTRGTPG